MHLKTEAILVQAPFEQKRGPLFCKSGLVMRLVNCLHRQKISSRWCINKDQLFCLKTNGMCVVKCGAVDLILVDVKRVSLDSKQIWWLELFVGTRALSTLLMLLFTLLKRYAHGYLLLNLHQGLETVQETKTLLRRATYLNANFTPTWATCNLPSRW